MYSRPGFYTEIYGMFNATIQNQKYNVFIKPGKLSKQLVLSTNLFLALSQLIPELQTHKQVIMTTITATEHQQKLLHKLQKHEAMDTRF